MPYGRIPMPFNSSSNLIILPRLGHLMNRDLFSLRAILRKKRHHRGALDLLAREN
jgi:hypothetical protein